jgi:hypothetical protein
MHLVEATILSKSSLWYYEEEWRTHSPEGPGLYKFKPESLTGIILGYTMPQEQQDLLSGWLRSEFPRLNCSEHFRSTENLRWKASRFELGCEYQDDSRHWFGPSSWRAAGVFFSDFCFFLIRPT